MIRFFTAFLKRGNRQSAIIKPVLLLKKVIEKRQFFKKEEVKKMTPKFSKGAIVLAAGKGTRMHSNLPKVLQPLAGKPLLAHVLEKVDPLLQMPPIVVFGYAGDAVKAAFSEREIIWAEQTEQNGTGDAVRAALPYVEETGFYWILVGDSPLLKTSSLVALYESAQATGMAVLVANQPDPSGYGRILRDEKGYVSRIVEEKDADAQTRQIQEVNSGLFVVRGDLLKRYIPQLRAENAQGEYYLTDIIGLARQDGINTCAFVGSAEEMAGVNDKAQLAALERYYQQQQAKTLMAAGVTLIDPSRLDIRGSLQAGQDSLIDVNNVFIGEVTLGKRVTIYPNCVFKGKVDIGDDVTIYENSVIESATIESGASVGPFARLRPAAHLKAGSKVGNFVEIKKSTIGAGSKVNHLSYIGDSVVGEKVNIGAGTITCNYDGKNKFQTVIADGAFIGSNTALVAPVRIGEKATVAAGSTITQDVADAALAVARERQREIKHWQKKEK